MSPSLSSNCWPIYATPFRELWDGILIYSPGLTETQEQSSCLSILGTGITDMSHNACLKCPVLMMLLCDLVSWEFHGLCVGGLVLFLTVRIERRGLQGGGVPIQRCIMQSGIEMLPERAPEWSTQHTVLLTGELRLHKKLLLILQPFIVPSDPFRRSHSWEPCLLLLNFHLTNVFLWK